MLFSSFTLLKGGITPAFQGLYDATGSFTQLDDANEGDFWIVNVAGGDLLVNDQLVCYVNVTGTPTDLDNFFAVSYSVQNMVGATDSANGIQGIIPAPLLGEQNKFLKGSADWVNLAAGDIASGTLDVSRIPSLSAGQITTGTFDDARIADFTGATPSVAGSNGGVPQPAIAEDEHYLMGDGTWQDPNTYDYTSITLGGNVITNAGSIKAEYVESTDEHAFVPQAMVDYYVTGFEPVPNTTMTVTPGSRQFDIAPTGADFKFWVQGTMYTKSTQQSKIWTDTTGIKTFYFDASGNIQFLEGPLVDGSDPTKCVIASIYWDATNSAVLVDISDQRHSVIWPTDMRYRDDELYGTQWISGALPDSFTISDGSLDAHARFEISSGIHRDADLRITTPFQDKTIGVKIVHQDDGGTDLVEDVRTGFNFLAAGTGRVAYDSSGVQAEATDEYFVLCHLAVDNSGTYYSIQGRAEYATVDSATSGALSEWTSIKSNTIAGTDIRPVGSVILQTATAYTNTVKARCVLTSTGANFVDLRTEVVAAVITGSISATNTTLATGGFDKNLSGSDTDVQTAMGTVNDLAIDTIVAPTDVTTNNVTTAAHGLIPKLPNVATKFFSGIGIWDDIASNVGGYDVDLTGMVETDLIHLSSGILVPVAAPVIPEVSEGGLVTELKYTDFTIEAGKRYVVQDASLTVATLPVTITVGDEFEIISLLGDTEIRSGAISQSLVCSPDVSIVSSTSNELLGTLGINKSSHWSAISEYKFYELEQAERVVLIGPTSGKGYGMGGYADGSGYEVTIDGINFVDETSVNPSTSLSEARYDAAGVSGPIHGYAMGGHNGSSYSSTIDGIVFATEGAHNPSVTLTVARRGAAGSSSSTHGYVMGGYTGSYSNEIDGIVFATELSNNPVAALSVAKRNRGGTQSATHGYAMGGYYYSSVIDGIVFATEAANNPAVTLSVSRSHVSCTQSETHGYAMGGLAGSRSNIIDGIVFATEAANNPAATLSIANSGATGASSSTTGYVLGGYIGSYTSVIRGFTFSTETSYTPSATLSEGRNSLAGISSSIQAIYSEFDAPYNTTDTSAFENLTGTTVQATLVELDANAMITTINGLIETVDDQDYTITLLMPYSGVITKTTTQSLSGTCTATFRINANTLDGTANSVSTSIETQDHVTNTFSEGDTLKVTINANSSCLDMAYTLTIKKG